MKLSDMQGLVIGQFKTLTKKVSDAAGEVSFKPRGPIQCVTASILEDTVIQSMLVFQGAPGTAPDHNYTVDLKVYMTGMPSTTMEIASFTFSGSDDVFVLAGMDIRSTSLAEIKAAQEIISAVEKYYLGELDTERHAAASLTDSEMDLINTIISQQGTVSEEAIAAMEERISSVLGHVWTPNMLAKICGVDMRIGWQRKGAGVSYPSLENAFSSPVQLY